jgi:hypothetical protein
MTSKKERPSMDEAIDTPVANGAMEFLTELGTIESLVEGRKKVYGDPVFHMIRVASVWSGILGHDVRPSQVPLLMAGLKMVRASETPDYSDNSDDIDGYMDIFRRVVGDDMIYARSVLEYEQEKKARNGEES